MSGADEATVAAHLERMSAYQFLLRQARRLTHTHAHTKNKNNNNNKNAVTWRPSLNDFKYNI